MPERTVRSIYTLVSSRGRTWKRRLKEQVAGFSQSLNQPPQSATKGTIHRLRSYDMSRAVGGGAKTAGRHSDLHYGNTRRSMFRLFKGRIIQGKDGALDASISNANERCLANAATSDGTNPRLTAELRNKTVEGGFFFFRISSRTNAACL